MARAGAQVMLGQTQTSPPYVQVKAALLSLQGKGRFSCTSKSSSYVTKIPPLCSLAKAPSPHPSAPLPRLCPVFCQLYAMCTYLMVVHLTGMFLMGAHLMGVSHRGAPYGRVSHEHTPHRRALTRRALHYVHLIVVYLTGCTSHKRTSHGRAPHERISH
jgi:hypothetical protein